jgi:glycerol kinase
VTATKHQAILDLVDPDRARSRAGTLRCGTVDTYVAWVLSEGTTFVTDATNAGLTGLVDGTFTTYDDRTLDLLGISRHTLPDIVDSSGIVGMASALDGSPPITGIAGDQQASLIGQGCIRRGDVKITFGTGAMLNLVTASTEAPAPIRAEHGTFPIVAFQLGGVRTWGLEAIALSAGTCVEWLRDDLGFFASAAESDALAASVPSSDGVMFVPAFVGLGTPVWDFGARGALLGLTRGSGRAHITRAVLEGIAWRGADLVEAAEADSGLSLGSLAIDGGLSQNKTFVQALANATGRSVELSSEVEATTRGAGFLAGLAVGMWETIEDAAATVTPRDRVDPTVNEDERVTARLRWLDARSRAEQTIPELSSVSF